MKGSRGAWAALCAAMAIGCGGSESNVEEGVESQSANGAPVVRSVEIQPATPVAGDTIRARVDYLDPDGDPATLHYTWKIGGRVQQTTDPHLRLTKAIKGSVIEVSVVARDSSLESEPQVARVRLGNRPPMMIGLTLDPQDEVRSDRDLSVQPRAEDPDGDELSYSYTWRVNGREALTEGATLPAREIGRGDRISISVVASDGQAQSRKLESDDILVGNAPPRITSRPVGFDGEGVFRYQLVAQDEDGDGSFRFRVIEGPRGMKVDALDGLVTWTPDAGAQGSQRVELEVDDRNGGRTSQSFQLQLGDQPVASPLR